MTIYDVRRDNAKSLAGSSRGAAQKFAEKAGLQKQQVSHIIGIKTTRNIGDRLARDIEQAFSMPVGWMDIDQSAKQTTASVEQIDVPRLLSAAGMHDGEDESADVCQMIRVSKDWARKNLGCAFEHIATLTASGDTMSPNIESGALLFVDRGATKPIANGVYVVLRESDSEVLVIRLHKNVKGELVLSHDNKIYSEEVIGTTGKAGLMVLGRVMIAMNLNKL